MVFSSIVFIFIFLPIVLFIFHLSGKKLQFPFLLLSSLFFYFYGETYLIWIMLTTTTIDYFCGLMIVGAYNRKNDIPLEENAERTRPQRFWLVVSIVSNLALLGYFKYFNFFTDNLIHALDQLNMQHLMLNNFIKVSLPLGISFYTFQSMSYTIDVYRGHVAANRSYVKFATFVTMFPQLVAGPIVRYADIEKQLNNHSTSFDGFVEGIKSFIIGLAKKILIANTMGGIADQIFALHGKDLSTSIAWLGLFAYSLQIYYDFSGYSCMAIGLGKMIGFEFIENFNYPYTSGSLTEFWRRWHISLSSWFRDYLFIPLGGSRSKPIKTYRNLFIVFLLCGLWHGASWNFIIWGMFHGLLLSVERMGFAKWLYAKPKPFKHIYFIFVILISWVFFRIEALNGSFGYLSSLFIYHPAGTYQLVEFLQPEMLLAYGIGIVFALPVLPRFLKYKESLPSRYSLIFESLYITALFILLFMSIINLAAGSFNPFIYFRF